MIKQIILALFAFVILSLVVIWVLNRGPQRLYAQVKTFSFIGASSTAAFSLPWQPANIFPFVEDEDLFGADISSYGTSPDEQFRDIEEKYGQIVKDAQDVLTFGDPSPYVKSVFIGGPYSNPRSSEAQSEYIVVEASSANTSPVVLNGWSLQSALTGVRVPLPPGAAILRGGTTNNTGSVSLEPGASAIVTSGSSPTGVSFRENICSGYLSQFQNYEPSLSLQCPSAQSELPLNAQNLQQYGDECFDYLYYIPTCEFPASIPSNVSPACSSYLKSTLSYNGCVNRHYMSSSFARNVWRLYLGANAPLWRDQHDTIRLLDGEGKTVDVLVY